MVMEINQDKFEQEVLKSDKPVAVDYWAPWCGPCKMVAPVFEKLSKELGEIKFIKVNVDDNQDLASQHGIMGIPCIVIYKNGEEVDRIVGFNDESQLKEKLTSAL